ncbi:MAG: hypothetical protein KF744_06260 [Taibaiella sp.]|nr:hypothetical protein [Taibaiella sp.]
MITRENYEEYMMMHADGELSPAEEQELMSFLYEHPEYQHELTAFSMTKLIPDDKLVYTRKVSLLKREGGAMVVPFAPWKRYAVAAGVAAVLMMGWYQMFYNAERNSEMSVATTTVAPVQQKSMMLAANEASDKSPSTAAEAGAPQKNDIELHEKPTPAHQDAATVENNLKATQRAVAHTGSAAPTHTNEIAALNIDPITDVKPAAFAASKNNQEISVASVTNLPPAAIYVYEGENETKQSIVAKLPIDELKKEGMENVVAAVANGYDRINAIKQGISETVVSFKVEKRKLIVSF